jgi:hypothetical protein
MRMRWNAITAVAIVVILGAVAAEAMFAEDPPFWPEDDSEYAVRTIAAHMFSPEEKDTGTLDVRFYSDMPNVPYVSLSDYYYKIQKESMTVRSLGGGVLELSNDREGGSKARLDTGRVTLTSDDFRGFAMVKESDGSSGFDCKLVSTASTTEVKTAETVTVDLRSYGIVPHTDRADRQVWLPLQTASDLFIGPNMYFVSYVGDAVYFMDSDTVNEYSYYGDNPEYWGSVHRFMGEDRVRPADLAEYTYNEMCLMFDLFYGKPGLGAIAPMQKENGLDSALQAYSDSTRTIRSFLLSEDYAEFIAGFWKLGEFLYDGGHTNTSLTPRAYLGYLTDAGDSDFALQIRINANSIDTPENPDMGKVRKDLTKLRKDTWDMEELAYGTWYYSSGDTAVYTFDHFDFDQDEWTRYIEEGGYLPADCIGQMYVALGMAVADPAIVNFVIDISTNTGGVVADVAFFNSLLTAQDFRLQYGDVFTDSITEAVLKSDINLDGVFDEKDHEKQYSFNFGILASSGSFSSGNYLPVSAQNQGIMILGETSGGGSCTVGFTAVPSGFMFPFSSATKLMVGYGQSGFDPDAVEHGAAPDAVLVTVDPDGNVDYSGMYDIDVISQRMAEFYDSA